MLENGLYLLKHSLMSWQIKNSMNDKPRNIDMKSEDQYCKEHLLKGPTWFNVLQSSFGNGS
jgi:hypothetical protein